VGVRLRSNESWLTAGLRVSALEGLGEECTFIFDHLRAYGDSEQEAAWNALVKMRLTKLAAACDEAWDADEVEIEVVEGRAA
jgi:hypothetical protein